MAFGSRTKISSFVKGKYNGRTDYRNLRADIDSFILKEKFDNEIEKKNIVKIIGTVNEIKTMNKQVSKIIAKNVDSEKDLSNKLSEIVGWYSDKIISFNETFELVRKAVSQAQEEANRLDVSLIQKLSNNWESILQKIGEGKTPIYPDEQLDAAEKELDKVINLEINRLKKDISEKGNEIRKVGTSKRFKKMLKYTPGAFWFGIKANALINKFKSNSPKRLLEIQGLLDTQLSTKMNLTFFSLVIEYIDNMEYTEVLVSKIRDDCNRVVVTLEAELTTMIGELEEFIAIFRNEAGVDELNTQFNKLQNELGILKVTLENQYKDLNFLVRQLDIFKKTTHEELVLIKEAMKGIIKHIRENKEDAQEKIREYKKAM